MAGQKIATRRPTGLPADAASSPRSRVLKAAFALFREQGFAATSMLDIATRARVSKRDLYALFANKHALLADCIEERGRAMRARLDPAIPAPTGLIALRAMLVELGSTILRAVCRPDVLLVYRLAIAESDRLPEVAEVLDRNGRVAIREALVDFLAKSQSRGLVGPGDPAAMAARYFSLLWGDLLVRLLMRVRKPPGEDEIAARAVAATGDLLGAWPVPEAGNCASAPNPPD
jgi:AcrR family transcriptional regulator